MADRTDVWFRVKTSTRLHTIFNHYSDRAGVDLRRLRFFYDGHRLNPDDSMGSMDLDEGGIIDCKGLILLALLAVFLIGRPTLGLGTIIDFANRYKVKVEGAEAKAAAAAATAEDLEGKQAALTDELEDAQDLNECLVRSENNKMTEIDKLRAEVERLRKENERLKEGRGGSA
eukprot:g493.t1